MSLVELLLSQMISRSELCRRVFESGFAGNGMSPAFGEVLAGAEDDLADEQKAINRRDIFNRTVGAYDVDDYCPFTNYIRDQAKGLNEEVIHDISPSYSSGPDYTVALDTLKQLTGIDATTQHGEECQQFILLGLIKLQDVIAKRKLLDDQDFNAWLNEEHVQAKEKSDAELRQLVGDLDLNFDLNILDEKE